MISKIKAVFLIFGFFFLIPQFSDAETGAPGYSKLDEIYFYEISSTGSNYFAPKEVCTLPSLPVPARQQVNIAYAPVVLPEKSFDVARSRPFGLGTLANGGQTLRVRVALDPFEGPVDVYLAVSIPSSPEVLLFANNALLPLSSGIVPWKQNMVSGVEATITGAIPVSSLVPGLYTFYLVVTPSGMTDDFFLWSSAVTVP